MRPLPHTRRAGIGRCGPAELPPHARATGVAEPASQPCVGEQPLDRRTERRHVAGRHEQSRHPVLDRVREPADPRGDDRPPHAIAWRATTP